MPLTSHKANGYTIGGLPIPSHSILVSILSIIVWVIMNANTRWKITFWLTEFLDMKCVTLLVLCSKWVYLWLTAVVLFVYGCTKYYNRLMCSGLVYRMTFKLEAVVRLANHLYENKLISTIAYECWCPYYKVSLAVHAAYHNYVCTWLIGERP